MIDLTVLAFGRGPTFPAVGFVEDVRVFLTRESGFGCFISFQCVEVFQEELPRGLLGVVEFAGATGVFPKYVVDILKSLFKNQCLLFP